MKLSQPRKGETPSAPEWRGWFLLPELQTVSRTECAEKSRSTGPCCGHFE
jgi:hypothetical protein